MDKWSDVERLAAVSYAYNIVRERGSSFHRVQLQFHTPTPIQVLCTVMCVLHDLDIKKQIPARFQQEQAFLKAIAYHTSQPHEVSNM